MAVLLIRKPMKFPLLRWQPPLATVRFCQIVAFLENPNFISRQLYKALGFNVSVLVGPLTWETNIQNRRQIQHSPTCQNQMMHTLVKVKATVNFGVLKNLKFKRRF